MSTPVEMQASARCRRSLNSATAAAGDLAAKGKEHCDAYQLRGVHALVLAGLPAAYELGSTDAEILLRFALAHGLHLFCGHFVGVAAAGDAAAWLRYHDWHPRPCWLHCR